MWQKFTIDIVYTLDLLISVLLLHILWHEQFKIVVVIQYKNTINENFCTFYLLRDVDLLSKQNRMRSLGLDIDIVYSLTIFGNDSFYFTLSQIKKGFNAFKILDIWLNY